jgi:hypothetical protein
LQNIFAGLYLFGFSKYGHILGKTLSVAAPGVGLAGKPMGAQPWLAGTMCVAHETFYDWSTHQGQALCETTSVTWRFLQPLLKRFSRCPICVVNFCQYTFGTAVQLY